MAELTDREWQIIIALIDGHTTNNEIAAHLRMSEKTVRSYWSHIFAKLGKRNRVEVALWYFARRPDERQLAERVEVAQHD